jgi:hypothetical protein
MSKPHHRLHYAERRVQTQGGEVVLQWWWVDSYLFGRDSFYTTGPRVGTAADALRYGWRHTVRK